MLYGNCGRRFLSIGLAGLLGLFILTTMGCNSAVRIKYSPLASVESLVPLNPGSQVTPATVYVTKFTDVREDKTSIGKHKNGLGMDLMDIKCTDDLTILLSEATTDMLRKAGLQANQNTDRTTGEQIPASELAGYNYIFGGKIQELHVTTQPGWDVIDVNAKIVIQAWVKSLATGKEEWLGPIEGVCQQKSPAYISDAAITEGVDAAMQNCMRNLAKHLKASGTFSAK